MQNQPNFVLRCTGCGREYPFGTYSCPKEDGVLLAEYDQEGIRTIEDLIDLNQSGVWRFSRLLPNVTNRVSFSEGLTPCIPSQHIGPELNIRLHIKDEGRNPTGSFKDRAAALLISTEKDLGHSSCATASSGNAAGALALYAKLGHMDLYVFMYQPTREKLLHTSSFGPTVYLVETEQESDVHRLTEESCREFGWASLTTMSSTNPFNVEGYKTISYEIVRDIGLPDAVVMPIGSGTLGLGVWKGFKELFAVGIINRLPRLIGVQPSNVAPVVHAYENAQEQVRPVKAKKTVATGAVVDNPGIAGTVMLQAIRESQGAMIAVPEDKILSAWASLPSKEGLFAEPTGALSVAGLIRAREQGLIRAKESICCINSASGFKDIGRFQEQPMPNVFHAAPSVTAIRQIRER